MLAHHRISVVLSVQSPLVCFLAEHRPNEMLEDYFAFSAYSHPLACLTRTVVRQGSSLIRGCILDLGGNSYYSVPVPRTPQMNKKKSWVIMFVSE
jgi:hypothetical protein